jgi:hypothetical protein
MLVEAKPRIISGKQDRKSFEEESLRNSDMYGLALANTSIWDVI